MVRSVTHREIEWDDEQQDHMLALNLYRALTCRGCGGWLPDTTDPAADDDYDIGDPVRCHQCTAQSIASDRCRDARHPQALMPQVTRHRH